MVLFYIVIDFSPTSTTTNARLVRFETATPFVPYISALKGRILRYCFDKIGGKMGYFFSFSAGIL